MDYKELYHILFNKITDVVEELQEIQKPAEELYINSDIEKELDEIQNKKSDS